MNYLHSLILLVSLTSSTAFQRPPYNAQYSPMYRISAGATDSVQTPNDPPSSRTWGLALQLDEGTRKSHSVAENTAFVTGFFRGLSNRESFGELVCSLYHVYCAMEKALDASTDSNVRTMDYEELRRKAALERDMQFFFGDDWLTRSPSPATREYCAHIERTAQEAPYLLIAHQYTRYLGDLFGGQMMGNMATRSLDLGDEGRGIDFYKFPEIPNNKEFIEDWYSKLNELDLTDAQKQAIVDEGNEVFRLNIEILEELEGNGALTAIKFALGSMKRSLQEKLGLLRRSTSATSSSTIP
mmetsp:Transcript_10985/g.17908  ORF Transcript_10985/g.17908 Transcript_10985/m.17908 type:complete len:298 (+) Transcript_10985:70-963(+)